MSNDTEDLANGKNFLRNFKSSVISLDFMGLSASLAIHRAKQRCIADVICGGDYGEIDGDAVCRFTEYRVQVECRNYHPSLADFRIARRHLDEQVAQGILGVTHARGVREYVFQREPSEVEEDAMFGMPKL